MEKLRKGIVLALQDIQKDMPKKPVKSCPNCGGNHMYGFHRGMAAAYETILYLLGTDEEWHDDWF